MTAWLLALNLGAAAFSAAGVAVKFQAQWIFGVIAAAALAVRLAPALPHYFAVGWVKWIGKNSIVFYVAHWPPMWAACSALTALEVDAAAVFIAGNLVLGSLAGWGLAVARGCWPTANALFVWPSRKSPTISGSEERN